MRENTRERLIRGDIWSRALYMILFAFAYSVTKFIVTIVVIFQFFTVLVTGCANEPLLKFGNSLAIYVREILEFQTFNTELQPFPFSPWPDEEPGGERWLDDEPGESLENETDDLDADESEVPGGDSEEK